MTAVVLSALKVKEHQPPTVRHIVFNRYVIVGEVIVRQLIVAGLTGHHKLQVTLMVFRVDVLVADEALGFATVVIVDTGTADNTLTSLTLDEDRHKDFALPCPTL